MRRRVRQRRLPWLDDGQAWYLGEVAFVEGGHLIAALEGGGRENQVIKPIILPEACKTAQMRACS